MELGSFLLDFRAGIYFSDLRAVHPPGTISLHITANINAAFSWEIAQRVKSLLKWNWKRSRLRLFGTSIGWSYVCSMNICNHPHESAVSAQTRTYCRSERDHIQAIRSCHCACKNVCSAGLEKVHQASGVDHRVVNGWSIGAVSVLETANAQNVSIGLRCQYTILKSR